MTMVNVDARGWVGIMILDVCMVPCPRGCPVVLKLEVDGIPPRDYLQSGVASYSILNM